MGKTILLVEDNITDEKLTLRAFKKSGIANEIVVARDGVEALDYLFGTGNHEGRDISIQPAVVLLDMQLPKIGGLEVLRRVREDARTKLIPIVILSSSTQEEDLLSAYTSHANGYVRKPVQPEVFEQAVQNLGLFWLLTNEPHPASAGIGRMGAGGPRRGSSNT
jgi:two-component system response regulator